MQRSLRRIKHRIKTTGHLIRVAARMGRDRTRHRLTHSVHNPQLA